MSAADHSIVRNISKKSFESALFNAKVYPQFSNNRGGWNKRGGGAKVAKSINVEGGIFWKKLVHKCNKRGVEGRKNLTNQ